ncbi:hypothetical protein D3C86_1968240 [compost metagenome]
MREEEIWLLMLIIISELNATKNGWVKVFATTMILLRNVLENIRKLQILIEIMLCFWLAKKDMRLYLLMKKTIINLGQKA